VHLSACSRGEGDGHSPIRVVVADAQTIDRKGMVVLLDDEPDIEVVGEAASADEMMKVCRRARPDVLVVTLRLPGARSESIVADARAAFPALRVLALSERGVANCLVLAPPRRGHAVDAPACAMSTDCLQLAAAHGANGTLRRSAAPEELFQAIRTVASGHAWYESGTAARLSTVARAARVLTLRERDVATLVGGGSSNKEIAETLAIREPTVKKHIGHIIAKLGLADRLQLGLLLTRNPLMLRR